MLLHYCKAVRWRHHHSYLPCSMPALISTRSLWISAGQVTTATASTCMLPCLCALLAFGLLREKLSHTLAYLLFSPRLIQQGKIKDNQPHRLMEGCLKEDSSLVLN